MHWCTISGTSVVSALWYHQRYLTCQCIGIPSGVPHCQCAVVPSRVPHLLVHWCTIRGTSLSVHFNLLHSLLTPKKSPLTSSHERLDKTTWSLWSSSFHKSTKNIMERFVQCTNLNLSIFNYLQLADADKFSKCTSLEDAQNFKRLIINSLEQ